jgi:hypothetical protein
VRAVRSTGEGVEIVDVDDPEGPRFPLEEAPRAFAAAADRAAGAINVVIEIA